jgi:hypothetical protein
MRTKLSFILPGLSALALLAMLFADVVPVRAHHAFGAEFDANRPLLLKGKVTKLEWVNPHAWIHLEVPKADGPVACEHTPNAKCDSWMVEGGTPNTLLRRGVTRDSLKIGTEIVVDGYQSKDRSNRANGRDVTFPDGRKLFMGSSGTGAPRDGKDVTEPPAPGAPPAR